jgi:hypothetical protein
MAIVEKLYISTDGIARSALLRTDRGNKTRPLQRLHSLEFVDSTYISDESNIVSNETSNVQFNDKDIPSTSIQDSTPDVDNSTPPSVDIQPTKVETVKMSKCGRTIKPVQRFDL